MAHKRVSQVGVTTSFSKLYPAHKRVSQVEMAHLSLNFTLGWLTKGSVNLEDPLTMQVCEQRRAHFSLWHGEQYWAETFWSQMNYAEAD